MIKKAGPPFAPTVSPPTLAGAGSSRPGGIDFRGTSRGAVDPTKQTPNAWQTQRAVVPRPRPPETTIKITRSIQRPAGGGAFISIDFFPFLRGTKKKNLCGEPIGCPDDKKGRPSGGNMGETQTPMGSTWVRGVCPPFSNIGLPQRHRGLRGLAAPRGGGPTRGSAWGGRAGGIGGHGGPAPKNRQKRRPEGGGGKKNGSGEWYWGGGCRVDFGTTSGPSMA